MKKKNTHVLVDRTHGLQCIYHILISCTFVFVISLTFLSSRTLLSKAEIATRDPGFAVMKMVVLSPGFVSPSRNSTAT